MQPIVFLLEAHRVVNHEELIDQHTRQEIGNGLSIVMMKFIAENNRRTRSWRNSFRELRRLDGSETVGPFRRSNNIYFFSTSTLNRSIVF
jgi:hypothetical protein